MLKKKTQFHGRVSESVCMELPGFKFNDENHSVAPHAYNIPFLLRFQWPHDHQMVFLQKSSSIPKQKVLVGGLFHLRERKTGRKQLPVDRTDRKCPLNNFCV